MRMHTMVLARLLGACGSASGQEVPVDTSSGGSGGWRSRGHRLVGGTHLLAAHCFVL